MAYFKRNINRALIAFLFCIAHAFIASGQKKEFNSILLTPEWELNDSLCYHAELNRSLLNSNFDWSAQYTSKQVLIVTQVLDSAYIVTWHASGFPINIFKEYPGPMFDWFQEWSDGKTLTFEVRFTQFGVPDSIINPQEIQAFYSDMVDDFITELPTKNLEPLNNEAVLQSLNHLKNRIIQAPYFANEFLSNLAILFPLYGKTFFENQDKKLTQYKQFESLNFSVPIEVHTTLDNKKNKNIYILTSIQKPKPFAEWRIKPKGYASIDFNFFDQLDFVYDAEERVLKSAIHKTEFTRNNNSFKYSVQYTLQ